MTNYSARSKGKIPKTSNKKDGGPRLKVPVSNGFWGVDGFMPAAPNEWTYTWDGEFPTFHLMQGPIACTPGWVAICEDGRQIPLGQAAPAEIKARLDDLILEIMGYEAELIETDWLLEGLPETRGPRVSPIGAEPIGPEIDIDLWMSRPAACGRQSTQAVQTFARRHKTSLSVADEMICERGE